MTPEDFTARVVTYLYGPKPKQPIAEVQFANSQRRELNRSDLVTPAVLEEAISYGTDQALTKSGQMDALQGVDADDVIAFLDRHFLNLARLLSPQNIPEHCPQWFEDDPMHVVQIVPALKTRRRTAASLLA